MTTSPNSSEVLASVLTGGIIDVVLLTLYFQWIRGGNRCSSILGLSLPFFTYAALFSTRTFLSLESVMEVNRFAVAAINTLYLSVWWTCCSTIAPELFHRFLKVQDRTK